MFRRLWWWWKGEPSADGSKVPADILARKDEVGACWWRGQPGDIPLIAQVIKQVGGLVLLMGDDEFPLPPPSGKLAGQFSTPIPLPPEEP